MSQTVIISVPDTIVESYPTQDALKHSIYESMIINEFQKGFLSIQESAQLLGLSYEDFLEYLNQKNISFIIATPQDLEDSYQELEDFLQTYKKI